MSQSVYLALPLDRNRKEFRLLQLLPGEPGDPVRCQFSCHQLDESLWYTALSYTWGKSKADREILIKGSPFFVRDNLWQFLLQARRRSNFSFIWIDAVCINQDSVFERNHQVGLMREIYSKASIVVTWLGTLDKTTHQAMNWITEMHNSINSPNRQQIWSTIEWDILLKFCQNSYWSRVWIVQEVLLARDFVVWCGSKSLNSDAMRSLASQQLFQDVKEEGFRRDEKHNVWLSNAIKMLHERSNWKSLMSESYPGFPLATILVSFDEMESTEARDRVYGLLGLCDPKELSDLGLVADYARPETELYEFLMKHFEATESERAVARLRPILLRGLEMELN